MGSMVGLERPWNEDARAARSSAAPSVFVYGRTMDNDPFHDIAPMLSVHAHGGTLALAARVQRGQKILLINSTTQEERECRVVFVGSEQAGKCKVCVEFTQPAPKFFRSGG